MTVTVKKVGGSVAVVIPKAVARDLELAEGTVLSMSTTHDSIVMRKRLRRSRRSMSEIVAQIKTSSYRRRRNELGQDPPVGREVW